MVKQIIFDLGNVILDIDFNRTKQAFIELGATDFQVGLDGNATVFDDLETGKIDSIHFIDYWMQRLPGVTPEQVIDAWNALLVKIDRSVLPFLRNLSHNYQLFIYSNTNAIHIDWVRNYLREQFDMEDWEPQIFTRAYYSHELGYRKPDDRGFLKIVQNHQLDPSETLFIDDFLPSIQTAMRLGFQTIHKPPTVPLVNALNQSLL